MWSLDPKRANVPSAAATTIIAAETVPAAARRAETVGTITEVSPGMKPRAVLPELLPAVTAETLLCTAGLTGRAERTGRELACEAEKQSLTV